MRNKDTMTTATTTPALQARNLSVGYGGANIITDLNVSIPTGEFTVIVGPNACGKSTLLRSLARVLPAQGTVLLQGEDIHSMGTKEIARIMGLLPQSPTAPDGIVVYDLISRGRYPHQGILGRWTHEDEVAVERAMAKARVSGLRDKRIDELSGGQRQRVWLAMVLAQDTPVVLLDEPTTYLDVTHQVEFRYATNLVVMKQGTIVAEGQVTEVVTESLLKEVYALDCRLVDDPETGRPIVVPKA